MSRHRRPLYTYWQSIQREAVGYNEGNRRDKGQEKKDKKGERDLKHKIKERKKI
jgi:hypothetical protein